MAGAFTAASGVMAPACLCAGVTASMASSMSHAVALRVVSAVVERAAEPEDSYGLASSVSGSASRTLMVASGSPCLSYVGVSSALTASSLVSVDSAVASAPEGLVSAALPAISGALPATVGASTSTDVPIS